MAPRTTDSRARNSPRMRSADRALCLRAHRNRRAWRRSSRRWTRWLKVVASSPANGTLSPTPGVDRMISLTCLSTCLVRSSVAPGGKLQHGDQIGLVLLRHEAGRRARELPGAGGDQARIEDQHQAQRTHQAGGQPAIGFRHRLEAAVEYAEAGTHQARRQICAVAGVARMRAAAARRRARGSASGRPPAK